MTTNKSRQVALITGASSGFGLLASVELARRGLRVFGSMRDLGRGEKLQAAARAAGVEVESVALDVTSPESVAAAVREVERLAGGVDVLVNNAGFGMGGFFDDVALDEFREQFETNFFGVISTCQAVLPGMRARRRGRIINVSSIAGRMGNPGFSAYCSSKWALEGLSECMRLELKPLGIQVVLVEPGTFKTDIFERNRRLARRGLDPSSPNHARSQHMLEFVDKLVARNTQDPRAVARVIARAATVRSPRLRYLVGRDARGEALARALAPAGLFEWGVLKVTGLDKHGSGS